MTTFYDVKDSEIMKRVVNAISAEDLKEHRGIELKVSIFCDEWSIYYFNCNKPLVRDLKNREIRHITICNALLGQIVNVKKRVGKNA